eukprot:scaffold41910_cov30-Attheya_sp.AAC.2
MELEEMVASSEFCDSSYTTRFYQNSFLAIEKLEKLFWRQKSLKLLEASSSFSKLLQASSSFSKLFQASSSFFKLFQASPSFFKIFQEFELH